MSPVEQHYSYGFAFDRQVNIAISFIFTLIARQLQINPFHDVASNRERFTPHANILTVAIILLRSLTLALRYRPFGYDDGCMYIAWLSSIGFAIASWISLRWGVGLKTTDHEPWIPAFWEAEAIKAVFVIEIFYYLSIFFVKMSILFLYLRLCAGLRNYWYKGTLITMGLISMQFFATIVVVAVQCRPTQRYWNTSLSGRCIDITAFFYSTNIFTIITDLLMLALPIPTFWNLHRPNKDKLIILAVFLAGGISTIASCIRLYSVKKYTRSTQPLRDAATINTWSFIEINLAILCASVPAIKGLFTKDKATEDRSKYYADGLAGHSGELDGRKAWIRSQGLTTLGGDDSGGSSDAIEMDAETASHTPRPPPKVAIFTSNDNRSNRSLPQTQRRSLVPPSATWPNRPFTPPTLVSRSSTDYYEVKAYKGTSPARSDVSFGSRNIKVSSVVDVEAS